MSEVSPAPIYESILVPFDGSGGSVQALRKALAICRDRCTAIIALSIDEHLPRYAPGVGEMAEETELRDAHFAALRTQVAAIAGGQSGQVEAVGLVGHAAQTIVRYAQDRGCDLIAIGHSGHSGLWGTLLGSTTARVVDQAHCDVLVVR